MNKFILNFYTFIYKILYKIFCFKPINNNQCVFCSIENSDIFGNLLTVKEELRKDFLCFSCFGKIDTIYKAVRIAKKLARSKFIFLNAAYTYTSIINIRKETQVIQLWHAAGAFKKFGLHSISEKSDTNIKKQKLMHGYYDYAIVSSNAVVDTYAEAFQMDKNRVLPLGVPRIQRLIEQNEKCKEYKKWLCNKYDKLWYKKIILYAPTFRENKGKRDYKTNLNIKNFAAQLPDEYILALKLHPRAPKNDIQYPVNVIDFTRVPQDIALICSDMLITDYSSIVFDFSALNKPIFFYTPDEIMYNRGLYFSPNKKYPCITFYDYYDMLNTIILFYKDNIVNIKIKYELERIRNEYIDKNINAIEQIKFFVKSI